MEISRTKEEIQEIASYIRLELYNMAFPCGPEAIKQKMEEYGEANVPSERMIPRILSRRK